MKISLASFDANALQSIDSEVLCYLIGMYLNSVADMAMSGRPELVHMVSTGILSAAACLQALESRNASPVALRIMHAELEQRRLEVLAAYPSTANMAVLVDAITANVLSDVESLSDIVEG